MNDSLHTWLSYMLPQRAQTISSTRSSSISTSSVESIIPQDGHFDSPLFTRLPPEIRELIWINCIGGRTVNLKIIVPNNRFGRSKPRLIPFSCGESVKNSRVGMTSFENQLKAFLPILRTCKAIYLEASPLLYATNTFNTTNADTIRLLTLEPLPSAPSQQHLRQNIRTLSLYWYLSGSLKCTMVSTVNTAIWTSIASLPRLHTLRITCRFHEDVLKAKINATDLVDATAEYRFLKPVHQITKPKTFRLALTWQQKVTDESVLRGLPCVLVRNAGSSVD